MDFYCKLTAGVLADPLSIIMRNLVAWISFSDIRVFHCLHACDKERYKVLVLYAVFHRVHAAHCIIR